jgi:hypothetical protein
MIFYAACVWWQKFEQTTATTELQKVQRLAFFMTYGTMKSASIMTLEAMLDLPPLPAMVKKEVAQWVELIKTQYCKRTNNTALRQFKVF